MARDGVFFHFAERIHPSFRTPSGALIFLGSIAALLALSGTYEELYSLFVFAVWIFFALTAIALLRLRRKEPQSDSALPRLGLSLDAAHLFGRRTRLTVNLWMVRPVRSSLGSGSDPFGGIPFFYRWRKSPDFSAVANDHS